MAMTQTYPSSGNSDWGGSAGNASESSGSSSGDSGSGLLGAALPILTAVAGINPIVGLVLNTVLGGLFGASKKKETQQQYPVMSGKGKYMSDQLMNSLMRSGGLGGGGADANAGNGMDAFLEQILGSGAANQLY